MLLLFLAARKMSRILGVLAGFLDALKQDGGRRSRVTNKTRSELGNRLD